MHIKDCAILESILTLVSKNGDLHFFPWWWYLHKGNQNLRPTKISQPADSFHPELHSDKKGLIWDPPRKSQRCSQSQTHKENIDGNITECFQAYKIQEIACAAAVYFIQFTLHPVSQYSYIRVSLSAKDESPISQHRVPLIHHGSPITQHGHHLHAQQIFLPAWGTL